MLRPLITTLAALAIAVPAAAADRAPSRAAHAQRIAGNDRPLTYVLIGAIIAAIVIATVDDKDSGSTPASP